MTLAEVLDQARAVTPHRAAINRHILIDAWRNNHAAVDQHIFWIKQHRETIRAGRERPEYIRYCRDRLEERFTAYLAAVRAITEAEIAMQAAGIPFNRHH